MPEHFEAHIGKSVPSYRENHDLIAQLSDFFVQDGSTIIELGASTGALCRRLADQSEGKTVRILGVEVEPDMVAQARRACEGYPQVEIVEDDATQMPLEKADLIVSYYTVQFIRPAVRQALIDKVYESLHWGGAFVLFEKVRGPDARFQDILSLLYSDFKLANGFSEQEIVQKSRSLKGVLEPFSTRGNLDMLERAGFVDHTTVFKHLCFEGFLAIK